MERRAKQEQSNTLCNPLHKLRLVGLASEGRSQSISYQPKVAQSLKGPHNDLNADYIGPPVTVTPSNSVHDRNSPAGSSLLRAHALRAGARRLLVNQVRGVLLGRVFPVGG